MRSGGGNKLSSFLGISCPSDPTLVTPYVESSVDLVVDIKASDYSKMSSEEGRVSKV